MVLHFVCPQGHQWHFDDDSLENSTVQIECPVCGASVTWDSASTEPVTQAEGFLPPLPKELSYSTKYGPGESNSEAFRNIPGYELLEHLGLGGMGVVLKARQLKLNRQVAIKMLSGTVGSNPELHRRFQSEAEAVAQLQHSNIVSIFDVGSAEGQPYFSMELLGGGTLGAKMKGAPLPPAECAQLVAALAEGVQYAHDRGIIHRDLKPANILFAEDGTPKISDFGLAKRIDDDSARTQSGAILGTPSYMAPEQAEGRLSDISVQTDVYALGAILYETLTGRAPFQAESAMATIRQVIDTEPVDPRFLNPDIPQDLSTIALKCLAKEPSKRYASAREFAQDLSRFLDGTPILARRIGPLERTHKWIRKRPAIASLSGLVVIFVVALIVGGISFTLKLGEALADANQQRDTAETRLSDAIQALDRLVDLGGNQLEFAPKLEQERRRIISEAISSYEDLLTGQAEDPKLRQRIGHTCRILGNLERKLEHYENSGEYLERAKLVLQALSQEFPNDLSIRYELAETLSALGILNVKRDDLPESLRFFNGAHKLAEQLAKESFKYSFALAKISYNRGRALNLIGNYEEAQHDYLQSIRICKILTENNNPALGEQLGLLASAQQSLGWMLIIEENDPHGEVLYREAIKSRQLIGERGLPEADLPIIRTEDARNHWGIGSILLEEGRFDEAGPFLKKAFDLRMQLVQDYPAVSLYADELIVSLESLVELYQSDNELETAVDFQQKQVELLESLTFRDSQNTDRKVQYAQSLEILARLNNERMDYEVAEQNLREAISIREKLRESSEAETDVLKDELESRRQLIETLKKQKDLPPGVLDREINKLQELEPTITIDEIPNCILISLSIRI